jgi:transforming growth factor-beta-induced protein
LVDALKAAGPFTVFAPNNAAFAKLPAGTVEALLADPVRLSQVLLYHVAEGRKRSTDLVAGKLVSLQGAAATVDLGAGVKINNAAVIAADVEASNGVIHVIDTVILPPGNLVEVALANPDFSTLVTALQAAGLVDALKAPGPFTVFAPNNAAFAKLPAGTVEALLQDPNRLRQILLYHVVQGPRLRAADLRSGSVLTMQGAPLRVKVGGSGVAINQAAVLAADVEAANGFIHVLDQVVLPADGFQDFAVFASVKANTVTLVWPAPTGQRQTLEASDSPAGPWSPFTAPTATYDGVSKVELDATAPMKFFRVVNQLAGN